MIRSYSPKISSLREYISPNPPRYGYIKMINTTPKFINSNDVNWLVTQLEKKRN